MTKNFKTSNKSIKNFTADINNGNLILNPSWQRGDVWKNEQKIELIISILKHIPLPAIYICQSENGKEEILDGKQRLTAIIQFQSRSDDTVALTRRQINRYELNDLCLYNNGKCHKYGHLTETAKRKFDNFDIAINTLIGNWTAQDRDDIFERIQNAVSHTNGEILYAKRHINKIIEKIVELYDSETNDDPRKDYFNVICKMFYCFTDSTRRNKTITNLKINSFFRQCNDSYIENRQLDNFLKLLKDFIQTFWDERSNYGIIGF